MSSDERTKQIAHKDEGRTYHGFDRNDGRGRAIGAMIYRDTRTFTLATEHDRQPGGPLLYRLAPGTYYCWRPQATRDGHAYGACQREHLALTAAAREVEIARYLGAAEKRAKKIK